MGAVVAGQESDPGPGVTGGATEIETGHRGCVATAIDQAALANHLVRVEQAVGPIAVRNSLHTGEVIRGENGLILNQFPEIRHMNTDVVDHFFRHLVPQFAALRFLCLAGKIKPVGILGGVNTS